MNQTTVRVLLLKGKYLVSNVCTSDRMHVFCVRVCNKASVSRGSIPVTYENDM